MLCPFETRRRAPRHGLRVGLLGLFCASAMAAQGWTFTEVTLEAGLEYEHGFLGPRNEPKMLSGGLAAADYDGDGWTDLYAIRGDIGPNLLLRNRRDGTFEEVGAAARVAIDGELGNGALFFDADGDGRLDLLLGGVQGVEPRLFRNLDGRAFGEVTRTSGLTAQRDTFSTAAGDFDLDGDLDLFLARWNFLGPTLDHFWINDGDGRFTAADQAVGLAGAFATEDWTFTPTFADIDADGWPDLLLASDFGTSRVFRNRGDGTFEETTGPEITDENGMGAAVGDYDNDGDLDWFVSSVWDPDGVAQGFWGVSGNRLYRNLGDGRFEDATDEAGVREGYWGWGSCFADLDNDGDLDLFHTNGIQITAAVEFQLDPTRLFVNNGDGSFTERSAELGIDAPRQGRGVACFDYDRDGDVDLLIANNSGPPRLYRNDLPSGTRSLTVALRDHRGNRFGVGAWITVEAGGRRQFRELRAGSNYLSQNPIEAHFGLGTATRVDLLEIRWPDGEVDRVVDPLLNGLLIIDRQRLQEPPVIPTLGLRPLILLASALLGIGLYRLRLP